MPKQPETDKNYHVRLRPPTQSEAGQSGVKF